MFCNLGDVLIRKVIEVTERHDLRSVPIIEKISFGGVISVTDPDDREDYRGRLFWAEVGDLIYSKIRAKQGSLGLVPPDTGRIAVSAEYPVYEPIQDKVIPAYLTLLLKCSSFLQFLDGIASGGDTKTRIAPDLFESLQIALPPLTIQRAIVAHWQTTQDRNATALKAADEHEAKVRQAFLTKLGLSAGRAGAAPRAFAARWSDIIAWNCKAVHLRLSQGDMTKGRYPVVKGKDCLASVQHGCSQGPSSEPTTLEILKISAATRGDYDRNQRKFIADSEQVRRNFDLRAGDVLMCRTNGTLDYVGMSALIREDEADMIFPDKLIRVRARENMAPEFLWFVLQTPPLRAQIETAARTAVGNYAIGGADIWDFDFPLPPLAIQKQLAAEVTAAREQIAAERAAAAKLVADTAREVEEMILGKRPVPTHP